jgi:hypothetical protein
MKEKINIAELLKDCPKGMELDCAMCENVTLNHISESGLFPIKIDTSIGGISLSKYGCFFRNNTAKCVIFPKGKTTWEGFVPPCKFEDGDILTDDSSIFIFQKWVDNGTAARTYCALHNDGYFENGSILHFDIDSTKHATDAEKAKLFQAIKDNGYKWNAETKSLDKLIVPKFKVGDRIRHKIRNKNDIYEISRVYDDSYGIVGFTWMIYMKYQDNYELVSAEPKFMAGDSVMRKCGASAPVLISRVGANLYYTYSHTKSSIGAFPIAEQDDWVLVSDKFDINVLKPFESKVLVRDVDHHEWEGAIFGRYDGKKFFTIGGFDWGCCIPYEGNEHLHGTTNDCDEFYKNW